jgi:cell division protein FtsB
MKWMISLLIILLLILQYQLWCSPDGLVHTFRLRRAIASQQKENSVYAKRNQQLVQQIDRLKRDPESLESLARERHGMIKQDEVFYRFNRIHEASKR